MVTREKCAHGPCSCEPAEGLLFRLVRTRGNERSAENRDRLRLPARGLYRPRASSKADRLGMTISEVDLLGNDVRGID